MSSVFIEVEDKYNKRQYLNIHHIICVEPDPSSKDYEKRCWIILSSGAKIHANETDIEFMGRINGAQLETK